MEALWMNAEMEISVIAVILLKFAWSNMSVIPKRSEIFLISKLSSRLNFGISICKKAYVKFLDQNKEMDLIRTTGCDLWGLSVFEAPYVAYL